MVLQGWHLVALMWGTLCRHGDGRGGGGSGRWAGGEMGQQVTLGPVDIEGLGAVFTAARLLPSPHQEVKRTLFMRAGSPSWTRACGLGEDTRRQFNRVRDDRVAPLQLMPKGSVEWFGQ